MVNIFSCIVSGVVDWVNVCVLGLMLVYCKYVSEYYVLKNFNIWYYFGLLVLLVLVNQIVIGIFLMMYYKISVVEVFGFIEYIMCDVEWGWLICYMYFIGVLLFFIVVYLYMFRGLLYGSYQKLCELVWILGMLIYLVLMVEVFMGYVLLWGQMLFWGVKVIILLFGVILVIGNGLIEWIMGDYLFSDVMFNCFFVLYVIVLLLVLLLLVVLYLGVLYEVGLNNFDGVEIKKGFKGNCWLLNVLVDGILFYLYYMFKDGVGVGFLLIIVVFIIFFVLGFGGLFLEYDNFIEVNCLVILEYIKLVWYYMLYYVMLCVVLNKLGGVLVMFLVIVILFLVLWLDKVKVKLVCYRGWILKVMLGVLVVCFVWLGVIGFGLGIDVYEIYIGWVLIFLYFVFFIIMLLWIRLDKIKLVLERVIMYD